MSAERTALKPHSANSEYLWMAAVPHASIPRFAPGESQD